MVSEVRLLEAVDQAFRTTAQGFEPWPNPHADWRDPLDEEYSRLTDPARYGIIGARADAWLLALADLGWATTRRAVPVSWSTPPGPLISRTDRVDAHVPGTLPLIVGRTWLGAAPEAGIVIGVGDPTVEIEGFPDCGCDACDRGSQDELDHLDAHFLGVVTGRFRRLQRGDQMIMTVGDGWQASGRRRAPRAEKVLADPRGWDEISGVSWMPT